MTFWWVIVIVVTSGMLLYGIGLLFLGLLWNYRLSHPRRLPITYHPDASSLPFHDFQIPLPRAGRLRGWTVFRREGKGTIVLCHHYRGNRQRLLPYAKFLMEGGYNTVLFDFLGHGESDPVPWSWTMAQALDHSLRAVLTALPTLLPVNNGSVGLMGFSSGTVPILIRLLEGTMSIPVRAVVFDSGPPLPGVDMWRSLLARSKALPTLPGERIIFRAVAGWQNRYHRLTQLLKRLHTLTVPVLFIQGSKDHIVPGTQTRFIYEHLVSAPRTYWEIPGAYHLTGLSLEREQYVSRVLDFFQIHLEQGRDG